MWIEPLIALRLVMEKGDWLSSSEISRPLLMWSANSVFIQCIHADQICVSILLPHVFMQIPADMVVNSMIVAMAAHANQPCEVIYQVGSSVKNPVRYSNLQDFGLRYFTKNPWINKDGKAVKVGKVTVLSTMDSFHRYMALRYLLLLKVKNHSLLS